MVPQKTWVSENFVRSLEISEAFMISLEVSFFHGLFLLFLSLKNFLPKSLGLRFLTRISAPRRSVKFYHSPLLIMHAATSNYSRTAVTQTLKGNQKRIELAGNSSY